MFERLCLRARIHRPSFKAQLTLETVAGAWVRPVYENLPFAQYDLAERLGCVLAGRCFGYQCDSWNDDVEILSACSWLEFERPKQFGCLAE